ncbi:cytochrome b/b6 domain-containing protein [Sulfitobacter geojensis]|uniref:cytochrome b/b6 domain-containing protein n=1 Tax=Sulfitobacter geojensis TaxID=1342299 RepID=UPI002491BF0C|nr:cytochrome b/b6 domain-containing protein [Sulfitobacter geojensis]
MAISNTETRYGGVSKSFHWLTALLILTLIPLGLIANWLPYETDAQLAQKAWLFSLHKTLGVTAFFVAFLRILWAISQPKPGLLNADKPAESFAAELVHWMLYAALVIVPLSGWISHAAASGFAPIWWPFGQNLPLVPKSTGIEHIFGSLHWVATKVLALSVLLHIAGALKHHVIDRDATLRRMLPGEPVIGPLPSQHHSKTPVFAAAAVWALVIAIGTAMGSGGQTTGTTDAALDQVASEWIVQDGSIAITVVQFGNEVSGSFADWTAAISFDETIPSGTVGHVTTTISIPSLTLGSVTQQAMGADFFDAETYATAVYDADIRHGVDGYEAAGTLTIKDRTMPLVMPFNLALNGDDAEMRADLTLDRRDFGIGDNMGDESSLAFAVKVAIKLTALRGPAQ